jgi:hypothetical protein
MGAFRHASGTSTDVVGLSTFMKKVRHKTFVGPVIVARLHTSRERIRENAEAFVNEIGADNVLSIAEHAMTLGPFSVVVWYRVEESNANRDAGNH